MMSSTSCSSGCAMRVLRGIRRSRAVRVVAGDSGASVQCLWRMHIITAFRAFPSPALGAYPPTHSSRRRMSRSDNSSAGSPVVLLHDDGPFLMRLLRLTEHPINRLCQTSRLGASALTRAELNRSRILVSTPRAKATAETASTVLSSSPPS